MFLKPSSFRPQEIKKEIWAENVEKLIWPQFKEKFHTNQIGLP